ncbi:fas-associated death domain protein-like [Rhagoletis pomonella]|uniref:fas-associated death domain protein-like n=1 Tax=Rhagoletis pomonella TaxID=28610 RepID=UPI00177D00BA|nr:fas-associated death domain protein-like [Rhagoletis pomonella]
MEDINAKHWSYDVLKEIALHEPWTPDSINEVKSMFINDIGSPRRYECIRTMGDLIDCLERRDVISEEKVEPLHLLGSKKLDEAIQTYSPAPSALKAEGTNQYHDLHIADELSHKLSINGQTTATMNANICRDNSRRPASVQTSVCPNSSTKSFPISNNYPFVVTEQKRAAIYKMLSQHLGTHWRIFGRELGIREGTMDEIELQCPRELSTRVYKVLKIYEEDDCNDPKMHLRTIKEALERARRKDLRRKIDDIISH